jgi:MoxR-like ATPase
MHTIVDRSDCPTLSALHLHSKQGSEHESLGIRMAFFRAFRGFLLGPPDRHQHDAKQHHAIGDHQHQPPFEGIATPFKQDIHHQYQHRGRHVVWIAGQRPRGKRENQITAHEPGTGKTMLAEEVAKSLEMPIISWNIKSTTKAQQGLYEYDAVSRLRDSQLGDDRVHDIRNYIEKGKLWEAFEADSKVVLLIDEIDKADIEFPNDLLQELDKMEFYVYETGEMVKAKIRPIVIITSNNEKELPDAFLRRCFFHYINFPDRDTMQEIVDVHYPSIKQDLVKEALEIFFDVRKVPGLKKKPSTSELIDWLKLLMADDIPEEILTNRDTTKAIPPLYGALVKNEQDVQLLERLAFMNRRQSSGNSGGQS